MARCLNDYKRLHITFQAHEVYWLTGGVISLSTNIWVMKKLHMATYLGFIILCIVHTNAHTEQTHTHTLPLTRNFAQSAKPHLVTQLLHSPTKVLIKSLTK